jgi:hypothetical protein
MSEADISAIGGSILSPAPKDASGGLDRYATGYDLRRLDDGLAGVKAVVGSEVRKLETGLNSTSTVLDGRISSLEKIGNVKIAAIDDKIDGLEKRMDVKIDGLRKSLDDKMAHLDRLRESDFKCHEIGLNGDKIIMTFNFILTLFLIVAVFVTAFKM